MASAERMSSWGCSAPKMQSEMQKNDIIDVLADSTHKITIKTLEGRNQ
jgi:hypothetical protein